LFKKIGLKRRSYLKRKYPSEIEHNEWIRRQNYFLEEQNRGLKKKLLESEEYINILVEKLKSFEKGKI
jgi:hypothetical protein